MTPSRDDVIRMAREAGFPVMGPERTAAAERFAALVAAPLQARIDAMLGQQAPTPEDMESQHWGCMDGATAYHLIQRHADDWSEAGRMMHAWLDAAVAAEREACAEACRDLMGQFDQEAQSGDLDEAGRMHLEGAAAGAKACETAIRARSTKP